MSSSSITSGFVGVVLGGAISLVGVWLQGVNGRRTQEGADEAALAQAHWLHQRKLQETTYYRLAELVLNVSNHLRDASRTAQDGGMPELLSFEGAQQTAASTAFVEVQVYASPQVRKLWRDWIDLTVEVSTGVGGLLNELRMATPNSQRIAVAWNQVDEQREAFSICSRDVLEQMSKEMAERPKLHKTKVGFFRRNA